MVEVSYFVCGHRTVWGKVGAHAKITRVKGSQAFCQKCGKTQTIKDTKKE